MQQQISEQRFNPMSTVIGTWHSRILDNALNNLEAVDSTTSQIIYCAFVYSSRTYLQTISPEKDC